MTWMPIESAPKDETWIILTDGIGVCPGYWGGTYFGYDPAWIVAAHRADHTPIELEHNPTHWMPLPDPPAAKQDNT